MNEEEDPLSNLSEFHQCNNCFFNEIHNNPEIKHHCNLFIKHVSLNSSSCMNFASPKEVAHVIVNHKSFSKKIREDLILNIILKKIEKEQFSSINDAILATREINNFEEVFEKFCDNKINELEIEDHLISRKPVSITTDGGWDKIRVYNETRENQNGTIYVRKIKLMMTLNGHSDYEINVED